MTERAPSILAFLCNWCSYAGADLAGVSRFQYPPNVRVIRVMCSGRIHPAFVLEAFKNGADAVLIAGCHIGDCHYLSGNMKTERRVGMLKRLMSQLGLEEDRLRLEWVSASEGDKFARIIREMNDRIKQLGPSPLRLHTAIAETKVA